jgi:hypothetical protein
MRRLAALRERPRTFADWRALALIGVLLTATAAEPARAAPKPLTAAQAAAAARRAAELDGPRAYHTQGAVAASSPPPPARPAIAAAQPVRPATPPVAMGAVAKGLGDVGPSVEVARALSQMRLTICTNAVQKAADFLIEGQPSRFIAQPLGPDANQWPVVFVIESGDPAGGHTRLSTLMIGQNCAGMYEQMVVWAQPCATIKAAVFANFTGEHPLLSQVYVSEANPALQVFLTPAGAGCVSVKKELFR